MEYCCAGAVERQNTERGAVPAAPSILEMWIMCKIMTVSVNEIMKMQKC